jgi:hypothetical protein
MSIYGKLIINSIKIVGDKEETQNKEQEFDCVYLNICAYLKYK